MTMLNANHKIYTQALVKNVSNSIVPEYAADSIIQNQKEFMVGCAIERAIGVFGECWKINYMQ